MEHEALGGEGRPNVAKVAIITGEAQGLRVRFSVGRAIVRGVVHYMYLVSQ